MIDTKAVVAVELWDAYDEHLQKVGKTLVRGRRIPNGLFHLVAEVLIRHADGEYLVMTRDKNKPIAPGQKQASAGGAVLKGETPQEGAKREALEETGIRLETVEYLGSVVHPSKHVIFFEYRAVTDCDKNAVTLQEGETEAFEWVGREKLMDMIENNQVMPFGKKKMPKSLRDKYFG